MFITVWASRWVDSDDPIEVTTYRVNLSQVKTLLDLQTYRMSTDYGIIEGPLCEAWLGGADFLYINGQADELLARGR